MNNNELLKKYESTTTTDLNNRVKAAVEKANTYAKRPELNQVELGELRANAIALADDYNRLVKLRRLGELASMSYANAVNAMTETDGETCPKMELALDGEIMNITTSNATRIRFNELLKAGQRPGGYENLEALVKVFTRLRFGCIWRHNVEQSFRTRKQGRSSTRICSSSRSVRAFL